jgi:hypothetical protein
MEKFVFPMSFRGSHVSSVHKSHGDHWEALDQNQGTRRTWYTVPPPLRRRMKGMLARCEAGKFTSFQGF